MRIYITTTQEPIFINPFLKKVIRSIPSEVVGVAIVRGSPFDVGNQSRFAYLLTLAVISGPIQFLKSGIATIFFELFEQIPFLRDKNPLSLSKAAQDHGIPVRQVEDVNSPEFLDHLRKAEPDVVINQAQAILSKELLSIPKLGSLNRHGALLPKYRGRLAPFWAYVNREKETGVSIHFIEEGLDSGPIVVQKKVEIGRFDTVNSLLKKIFSLAPEAMLEALDILRSGDYENELIQNDNGQASYFSSPTLKDAISYRKLMVRRMLFGA